jgi:hypothetical protein
MVGRHARSRAARALTESLANSSALERSPARSSSRWAVGVSAVLWADALISIETEGVDVAMAGERYHVPGAR